MEAAGRRRARRGGHAGDGEKVLEMKGFDFVGDPLVAIAGDRFCFHSVLKKTLNLIEM